MDSLKSGCPQETLLVLHHWRKSRYAVASRWRRVKVSAHPNIDRSASSNLRAGLQEGLGLGLDAAACV